MFLPVDMRKERFVQGSDNVTVLMDGIDGNEYEEYSVALLVGGNNAILVEENSPSNKFIILLVGVEPTGGLNRYTHNGDSLIVLGCTDRDVTEATLRGIIEKLKGITLMEFFVDMYNCDTIINHDLVADLIE